MACNMTPISVAISNWIAGGDGKVRGSDPGGLLGYADIVEMSMTLATAGRLGFYVDYSELATTGKHTFYVCRTHGSTGAVSCGYSFGGDTNSGTSGTLNWADGEMDIKTITATVSSKSAGDHRMWALLDTPTGGAALHHGVNTIAYGVIDDDTIATSNAIFIDADAGVDGTGTEGSPFNNWYSARDAVLSSTRYIYIKGMMIPDGTDAADMTVTVKNLEFTPEAFGGKTTETERLVVRGWPGFTGGIDGGAQTDVTGFHAYADTDSVDFITLRKLSFTNLNHSVSAQSPVTTYGKCYALRLRGSSTNTTEQWTTELITVNGIESGANAAIGVVFMEGSDGYDNGFKMWRWDIRNTQHTEKTETLNVLEYYRMSGVSVQRCTCASDAGDIFEKEGQHRVDAIGFVARFNHFKTTRVRVASQSTYPVQSFHIIQGNVFDSPSVVDYSMKPLWFQHTGTPSSRGKAAWIVGNVFVTHDLGVFAMIHYNSDAVEGSIVFNNIFSNIKRPMAFDDNGLLPVYADYDVFHRDIGEEQFTVHGTEYGSVTDFNTGTTYEASSTQADPLLDADFSNGVGSSAIGSGVSGTDCGYQLIGNELVGAA